MLDYTETRPVTCNIRIQDRVQSDTILNIKVRTQPTVEVGPTRGPVLLAILSLITRPTRRAFPHRLAVSFLGSPDKVWKWYDGAPCCRSDRLTWKASTISSVKTKVRCYMTLPVQPPTIKFPHVRVRPAKRLHQRTTIETAGTVTGLASVRHRDPCQQRLITSSRNRTGRWRQVIEGGPVTSPRIFTY